MAIISILDTKSANFHSVKKAVDLFEKDNTITSLNNEVMKSEALIIPGVSSTDTVLRNIYDLKLDKTILDFYKSGKPILCICVGMQILFENSEESPGVKGICSIPGKVEYFNTNLSVPHIGWNTTKVTNKNKEDFAEPCGLRASTRVSTDV